MDTNDQPVSPQVARSIAATEEKWRAVRAEFGLLTAQELSDLLGLPTPEDVRTLYTEGFLIAAHRGGRVLYPGFQMDREAHAVCPVIRELRLAAEEAGQSEALLILWMISPSGSLDGARPVDCPETPERALAAVREAFSVEP